MTFCVSNFCPGCNEYLGCRCGEHEAAREAHLDASYQAGFDSCAEGYEARPMTEWIFSTYHMAFWSDAERRIVYVMTEQRFGELTWRHRHFSAYAYRQWFERTHGYDLEAFLAGVDDRGAGLPSAVDDPELYHLFEAALEAYEPEPDVYGRPLGPWPEPVAVDDGLPF